MNYCSQDIKWISLINERIIFGWTIHLRKEKVQPFKEACIFLLKLFLKEQSTQTWNAAIIYSLSFRYKPVHI